MEKNINKEKIINELSLKEKITKEQAEKIYDILNNNFFLSKSQKENIKTKIDQEITNPEKIYNTCKHLIEQEIKILIKN